MNEMNDTSNLQPEDESRESGEFSAFNRLASMLISVSSDQIRGKLDQLKRSKGTIVTQTGEQPGNGTEAASHKDPD
jgi:hypothetical protein